MSAATKFATNACKGTVNAVTTIYHAAARAVRTTGTYFKNHAAAIASFAASTAVFVGCESFVTAGSAGTLSVPGAIACGALAGEVGGVVDQGAKCMDGQAGACSVGAFAESTVLGGVGGAVSGGLGGSLGGKLAESVLGKALPSLVTNTLEGAAFGGVSGAVTGAADYGMNCPDSGTGCSWSGAADATRSGAASGTIGGALAGAVGTGVAAARAKVFRGAEEEPGGTCPTTHSFTGSTDVVIADGSTKPIDEIKAGDKINNSVPGQAGTQTHTVDKVIVTHTDHDFVDVTIAQARGTAKPTPTSLRSRLLGKAKFGLASLAAAAAVLVGGQPAMAAGGQRDPVRCREAASAPPRGGGTSIDDAYFCRQIWSPDG